MVSLVNVILLPKLTLPLSLPSPVALDCILVASLSLLSAYPYKDTKLVKSTVCPFLSVMVGLLTPLLA